MEIVSAARPIEEHFFSLPLPLSVNQAYITLPNRRRVSSPNKRSWTEITEAQLDEARFPKVTRKRCLDDDRVRDDRKTQKDHNQFTIELVVKLASWRRDIDNCLKLLLDVLCRRLLLDDNYCIDIHIVRRAVETREDEGVAGWVYVYDPPRKGGSPRAGR